MAMEVPLSRPQTHQSAVCLAAAFDDTKSCESSSCHCLWLCLCFFLLCCFFPGSFSFFFFSSAWAWSCNQLRGFINHANTNRNGAPNTEHWNWNKSSIAIIDFVKRAAAYQLADVKVSRVLLKINKFSQKPKPQWWQSVSWTDGLADRGADRSVLSIAPVLSETSIVVAVCRAHLHNFLSPASFWQDSMCHIQG